MQRPVSRYRYHRGFSLVELMIATTLGLILALGIAQIFASSSRAMMDVSNTGRQIDSALYGLEMIGQDLQLAGYWGEASLPVSPNIDIFRSGETPDSAPASYSLPPSICIGTRADPTPKTDLAYGMAFPIMGGGGAQLNAEMGVSANCKLADPVPSANSDIVAIRRAATCAADASGCFAFDSQFHVQTNGCVDTNLGLTGGEIKLYDSSAALTYHRYHATDCDAAALAPMYRYLSRVYYVDSDDRLIRLSYASSTYTAEILVDGVERLKVEWGIDSSGDGYVDTWRAYDGTDATPGAVGGFTPTDWQNVVGAKLWMIVRSPVKDVGFTDSASYVLGGTTYDVPAALQSYRRTLQSTTVDLVNVALSRR